MDSHSSPQPPPKSRSERENRQALLIAEGLAQPVETSMGPTSWGERLLPFLFAAMETCWVDAIFLGFAGFGLFGSHAPLMPLWAPFIFIAGTQWLFHLLERRDAGQQQSNGETATPAPRWTPGLSLFIIATTVVTLLIIWWGVYSQVTFAFDPNWLLTMLSDILSLNVQAFHIFAILLLAIYFGWRGMRFSQHDNGPVFVFRTLLLGMAVIIAVIIMRAGQHNSGLVLSDEITLLLLIPLFLFLSLAAHALAQAAYLRHDHPAGLEGSVVTQERSLLLVIGLLGIVLLAIALPISSFANPAPFAGILTVLGTIYDVLVQALARIIIFLATPFVDLLSNILRQHPPQVPKVKTPPKTDNPKTSVHPGPPEAFVLVLKILLPLIILAVILLLLRWVLRQRRKQAVVRKVRNEEVRESVWSWALFWEQLKMFFRNLFKRVLPSKKEEEGDLIALGLNESTPAVRTIREIYRALLKRAAARGYSRKKQETPYEFQWRLEQQTPLADPQLSAITDAYTVIRYGAVEPEEADISYLRGAWAELDQKWKST